MSHFSVALMCSDISEIDTILAPYNENLEVAPYVEFTKAQIIKKEREILQSISDNAYAKYLADPIGYSKSCNSVEHIRFLQNELPHLLKADDEEIYQRAIANYDKEEIGKNGEIYSTYNSKAKWDWYEIGGRWDGTLLVKEDTENTSCGQGGVFGSNKSHKPVPKGYKWVDVAPIKSIEWELMHRIIERDMMPYDKFCKESPDAKFYKSEYFKEMYPDEETYKRRLSSFSTYAIVPYKKPWTAPGDMGWFGCSSEDPKEEINWEFTYYDQFIKPANQNLLLAMIDCHI